MQFPGFYGNLAVRDSLSAAFQAGRLPHAILLQGEDGLGKSVLAQLLARALVCTAGPEKAPCGVCPACRRALAGSHPDIAIAQASTKSGGISIEEVRRLRLWAAQKPSEAPGRVVLFFHMEKMQPPAQNALLKILEEPPLGVHFLLTCSSAASVLSTIQSRAQILTLSPLSPDDLRQAAKEQHAGEDVEKVERLLPLCGGNLGKLSQLLTEKAGQSAREQAEKLLMAMLAPREADLMEATVPFLKEKARFREIVLQMQWLARDACALRMGASSLSGSPVSQALSQSLTRERLMALPDFLEETVQNVDQNGNMNLLLTWFCARLRALAGQ